MAELRIRIRVSRRQVRWGAVALILSFPAAELGTERFSLSTYYPAPSGIYTRLVSAQDAYLARDGGAVGVGTTSPAPAVKLDVGGAANVTGDLAAAGAVSGGGLSVPGDVTAAANVAATGDITSRGFPLIANSNCSGGITCARLSGKINTIVINACDPTTCTNTSGKTCGTVTGTNGCGGPCQINLPPCCDPTICRNTSGQSCGTVTGTNGCGGPCTLYYPPCCVPHACTGCAPPCNGSCTGTDGCGPCTIYGPTGLPNGAACSDASAASANCCSGYCHAASIGCRCHPHPDGSCCACCCSGTCVSGADYLKILYGTGMFQSCAYP